MYLHIVFVTFALFDSVHISLSADPHWDYHGLGPDVWKDLYPTCGSAAQSPINILTQCTTYQSYLPFQFSSAYNLSQVFRLKNNGHTIVGEALNQTAFPLTLSGGGLNETFTFKNFHLHWGENYNQGSEHQINGQKYSGEIHFVHSNAAGTQNAVLGIFIQTSPSTHSNGSESNDEDRRRRRRKRRTKRDTLSTNNATSAEWERYFAVGDELNDTDDSTVINLSLATLMGTHLDHFYRYAGSLTTPPCTENVIWTVFETPVTFTDLELENFRAKIYSEDFRGPQPVYERTVYRNFPNAIPSSIPDYACCEEFTNKSNDGKSMLLTNRQLFIFIFFQLFFFHLIF